MLREMTEHSPKETDSVLKYVNLQDNIAHDNGGDVNDDNLHDYCCIKNYHLGQYIQGFTRKLVILNIKKIDIAHEVIRCIEDLFEAMDST